MLLWIFIIALFVFAFVAGLSSSNKKNLTSKSRNLVDSNVTPGIHSVHSEVNESEDKAKDEMVLSAVLGLYSKERSIDFFVNGAQFRTHAAQEEYCILSVGMDVRLKAEPENMYDKYAVKVFSSRKHIGYVSKDVSKHVFQVVEQGCVSDCVVIDNSYANKNDSPKLMHVRLFIKPKFVNHWNLDGYEDPVCMSE